MALYFISDLHLQEKSPAITQGFFAYLDKLPKDAEALYILGDFFEYWVGDDDNRELVLEVKAALNKLAERSVEIYFQHGNRDFLLGEEYSKACNMHLLDEEHLLEYNGQTYLLMHGDSLCTSDVEYMAFREQSRNPAWQQQILSLSLEERYALAEHLRETSQTETQNKDEMITDVEQSTVEARMLANNVQHLIHGHTHRPSPHQFDLSGQQATRTVLGDWSNTHGWQIILNESGIELSLFNFAKL